MAGSFDRVPITAGMSRRLHEDFASKYFWTVEPRLGHISTDGGRMAIEYRY
jgi:hypothetical protein